MIAAFPFPLSQGSQIFVRDQARALVRAGAEVTLFCYGSGEGPVPDDLELVRVPELVSPRALRAGPSPGKPLADAWLACNFAAEARRRGFDAALAHNAEAALAGLLARPACGVPVVYVAHTLLGVELDAYVAPALEGPTAQLGAALDQLLAQRVDAVIALCATAREVLGRDARGPVAVLPPGLEPGPVPEPAAIEQACARAGVEAGRFVLYTGNVDRYQDLDLLEHAARLAPELSVLVATHGARRPPGRALRCARVTPDEARALTFACQLAVLPRRRPGGFPIKLLSYMEAGRPIVAREHVGDSLPHGEAAWLVPDTVTAEQLAAALKRVAGDPELASRLGRGARSRLATHHTWPELAQHTLDLVRTLNGAP